MARVLVVDDLQADRDLACEILRQDADLDVETADDGIAALARIEEGAFDLVVTDLVMPNMDGLELVGKLRRSRPNLPAIIMTSKGSEEIAARALAAGAASYVPKLALAYDLLDNVRRVLAVSYRERDQARVMDCMRKSETVFALGNSDRLIPALVKHLQDSVALMDLCDEGERMQIGVALQEALANAMHHGNLEVDSAIRESDLGAYQAALVARAQEPPYRDRRVHVTASFSRDEARFVVRDEGPGFDPSTLPDPRDPENLHKASGRGVLLMTAFMDDVRYNESGNEVTMVKRRKG